MSMPSNMPSPEKLFNDINAYQLTCALKAAVDLAIFTRVAEGALTVPQIAVACNASERGIKSLCDFLVCHGYLTKMDFKYSLTPESAAFLNTHSPATLAALWNSCSHPLLQMPMQTSQQLSEPERPACRIPEL